MSAGGVQANGHGMRGGINPAGRVIKEIIRAGEHVDKDSKFL